MRREVIVAQGGVALILALLSWRSSNSYDFCDYS